MPSQKVWFVTGSARGFGRIWVEAALERGDRVVATARTVGDLDDLASKYGDAVLPLALDVDDRSAVFAAFKAAHDKFERIDVVINNAGYGSFGAIEEVSEAEARAQIETNLFGALWVTQAALPITREQKSGHIISISSIGGIVAFPNIGLYHASKWGLEGFTEALAQEVASFGINVTLVEPGGFATDWSGSSAKRAKELPAYAAMHEAARERTKNNKPGEPAATAAAMLKLVDADNPPLRLFLGSMPLQIARQRYAERLKTWESWSDVSEAAQGQLVVAGKA
jgi:NAD(P)-dependent dehydrogenase (short-subunit alcohol dehydrogenase family)